MPVTTVRHALLSSQTADNNSKTAHIDEPLHIDGVPLFDAAMTTEIEAQDIHIDGYLGENILLTQVSPFDMHPLNQALTEARKSNAYDGIVAVSAAQSIAPGLALINAESYRAPFGPPTLQVASYWHPQLLNFAANRIPVHLHYNVSRNAGYGTNMGTTIVGADPTLPPWVVMTPKSAWWTCTAERVGGIVIWLALLRHFAQHRPARTILFTANSGHELSHLGLDDFLQKHPTLGAQAAGWLHLGANIAARDHSENIQQNSSGLSSAQVTKTGLRTQASSADDLNRLTHVLQEHGYSAANQTPVATRPLGEARNIFDAGGRYISLLGQNEYFHHPQDRWPHSIDTNKTVAVTTAMVTLMSELIGQG